RPRVAIECKDVAMAGSVDEIRTFVARLYDITILRSHQPYLGFSPSTQFIYPGNLGTTAFSTSRLTYWQEHRRTFNAFARRTGFAVGSAAMTSYYSIEPPAFITAGSPQAADLMSAVAGWIDSVFPSRKTLVTGPPNVPVAL